MDTFSINGQLFEGALNRGITVFLHLSIIDVKSEAGDVKGEAGAQMASHSVSRLFDYLFL